MEKRAFGRTGMHVSVLGFGGAEIGFQNASGATVERLLNSALDAGLNVIDTAECYNTSEELIGNAIGHRRDQFFLFTKCGHAAGLEGRDWDPQLLEQSIDRSLKRLKTDRVDVIHLHTCSEELLRRGDVISVLQKARDAGKTRFIGYSGDAQAARYAVECSAFDALETSVSIADQESIALTLPLARARGMGVTAKRPVANIAWKYQSEDENRYAWPYHERLAELDYDFLKRPIEVAVDTALRFTLSQPGVCTAIVGTANPDRWRQNAAITERGLLPQDQIQEIRSRWQEVEQGRWHGLA